MWKYSGNKHFITICSLIALAIGNQGTAQQSTYCNPINIDYTYMELSQPQKLRYISYNNIHVPTPHLSISDLRVFGTGEGKAPKLIKEFSVIRKTDKRDALINWSPQKNSTGYNVLWGIAPDKLYSSWMVYGENSLEIKSLNTDQTYYFAIEAFNENGVSERSKLITVD